MRVRMRLSRDAVLALREVKHLAYNDPNLKVQNGYLIGLAFKHIQGREIDWQAVADAAIPNVTDDHTSEVEGVQTTVNLEAHVNEGIEEIQQEFRELYGKQRIRKPFVIKCILFAYILSQSDKLPFKSEDRSIKEEDDFEEPQSMEEMERSQAFLDFQDEYLDIIDESVEL